MTVKAARLDPRLLRHVGGGAAIGGAMGAGARLANDKHDGKKVKAKNLFWAGLTGATLGASTGLAGIPKLTDAKRRTLGAYAKKFGLRNPNKGAPRATGTAIGGALGAGLAASEQRDNNRDAKTQKKRHSVLGAALLGGGLGMVGGHVVGSMAENNAFRNLNWKKTDRVRDKADSRSWNRRRARQNKAWEDGRAEREAHWKDFWGRRTGASSGGYARPASSAPSQTPDWLKGVTTKAEAKTRFRANARQHHPDLGGDAEKFKKLNNEWEGFQSTFDKLAFAAFFDELMKISSAFR
jgi:hypothetical protein